MERLVLDERAAAARGEDPLEWKKGVAVSLVVMTVLKGV
jgi:hypothetical protein